MADWFSSTLLKFPY